MIYLFTGQPGSGKTTLAKKLQFWLQTDKKNWRKSVFHIDGDQLRELFPNTDYSKEGRYKNITKAFDIAKYLDNCDNDVLDYEPPIQFFIDLDTSDSPDNTFNKLIKILI